MKIAIISDIHSNLEALKATLKDIEKRDVDKIIVLGDIISKGVHPKECIDLIKAKCDVVIQGNCDKYLIIEGEYGSKEYSSDISFQFVKVPYDIDKELEDENLKFMMKL